MSIKIDLKIFLFALLFFFTKQIEIYATVMIFAFIHELAHLVCGLILGFKADSIKINPFGFQICFQSYVEDYNQKAKLGNRLCIKKMILALAGPCMNLLIMFGCLIIGNYFEYNLETIFYANLLLVIFNLLPIYPLDGGRILKQWVHIQKGKQKSYEIVNRVSKTTVIFLTFVTSIVILYIHNIAFLVILAYLWYLMIKNEKWYCLKKKIYEQVFPLAFFDEIE